MIEKKNSSTEIANESRERETKTQLTSTA